MKRRDLIGFIDDLLDVSSFRDYAPNGLQVEGREEIKRILCAVTASAVAVEAAVERGADALLVHHGMFWKSEPPGITGWKKNRIKKLLEHDINLLAYHLPLDAHPEIGNNAQLAKRLNLTANGQTGEQNLVFVGAPQTPLRLDELGERIRQLTGRPPLIVGDEEAEIETAAWCTGAGQGFFQAAGDEGVDVFITGEASEAQYHLARETGVGFIAMGHHASERYGIIALGDWLKERFGIETGFFDEDNPI